MTQKPRARELGIPFDGTPGPLNAITDVAGIEVGARHHHLRRRQAGGRARAGPHRRHRHPAARPASSTRSSPARPSLNGNGEMTGTTWIEESGFLEGPVMITNTHSVGIVRDAVIGWQGRSGLVAPLAHDLYWCLPVVAET